MNEHNTSSQIAETDIAVIGMSCRFPAAEDPEEFWENLRDGIESVTFFRDEDLLANGVDPELLRHRNYVKANPILKNPLEFDAGFFGIPPLEAEMLDPQQRIFLECAWEALESAGTIPGETDGIVGIFAGAGISSYLHRILPNNGNFFESVANFQMMLGNDKDYLPTRVSYRLNLTGPSVNVQTACSTSLVALHLACQSILNGDCDVALAGGASVFLPQHCGYLFQSGMIFSPDGHCRPFDANAKGTTFGSGVGVVALKLLSQALEEGDPIRAVVKGSAINNDGSLKVGFTAPSVSGQASVIAEAMGMAGVSPESISYLQAHGTATELGDPIEIRALTQAFRTQTDKKGYCAIGSVKSNFGHLISASGVAGAIATILALENQQIPPSLHFESPNPTIDFENSPFFVNTELKNWTTDGGPRIAGVSSFGLGGTNAHAIIAEAPAVGKEIGRSSRPRVLLTLSGESDLAVVELAAKYARFFQKHPQVSLPDAAYTTHVGRKHFPVRAAYSAADVGELIGSLESNSAIALSSNGSAQLAFLFTGQGAQEAGMGKRLYETEPVFEEVLTRCDEAFRSKRGRSLIDIIFAEDGNDSIHATEFAQPGIYAIECAIAALFMSWGIQPSSVAGHSIGEFAAAWTAGVFELEEGLSLVAERGRLMQELPVSGGMVCVFAPREVVEDYLIDGLSIAVENAPDAVVVSGPSAALEAMVQQLQGDNVRCKELQVSHGFHSPLMEPMLAEYERFASQFVFQQPEIPFISNLTGDFLSFDRPLDASYWTEHIRSTVRFREGLNALVSSGVQLFLEIGPKPILCGIGQKQFPALTWIPSLQKGLGNTGDVLDGLGQLYTCGVAIDWNAFHASENRLKIPLPTYAFQRQIYQPEKTMMPITSSQVDGNGQTTARSRRRSRGEAAASPHGEKIERELTETIAKMMRLDGDQIDREASFMALGLDSLTLLNVISSIEKKYGVTLEVYQFFDELTNLQQLTDFLIEEVSQHPLEESVSTAAAAPPPIPTANGTRAIASEPVSLPTGSESTSLERIIEQQLSLMAKQLEAMQGKSDATTIPAVTLAPNQKQNNRVEKTNKATSGSFSFSGGGGKGKGKPPTATQQAFIDNLVQAYCDRTQGSKEIAATYRNCFADRRSLIRGLRPELKELFYPIAAEKAKGSRIWDIDGNEYIDITMGFGVHLFGHNRDFIMDPIRDRVATGVQVGPQMPLAGEVAKLFAEVTGKERVTFCNSGTEAVMTALRIARAASGKHKIVKFKGAYHGHFDGTLAIPADGDETFASQPMFPGTSPKMVEDVIVLDYGKPESLHAIAQHKHELAAVLVEPVQSRLLSLAPKEFLQELRVLTHTEGIALIFDEVILGLRAAPGGAQEYFGIEADIATYGKALGGGMPIGVIAGKAKFMDRIDGGSWKFGDKSFPETEPTFFAGTFCKHPLAMTAAKAVLLHIKERGGALQGQLNESTARLVGELNRYFQAEELMLRADRFASVFRIEYQSAFTELYLPIEMDLLFYLLIHKGVYIWEGRVCFLSTAHTDRDIDDIVRLVKESVEELRAVGFFSQPKKAQKKNHYYPLTEEQQRLLQIAGDEKGSTAYNESISFELQGHLDLDRLRYAVQTVVDRHDALRTYFSADGSNQIIAPAIDMEVPLRDFSEEEPDVALKQWLVAESQLPFDLYRGPLIRVAVAKLGIERHVLNVCTHHGISDGWSLVVILEEICKIYSGSADIPPIQQFADYLQWYDRESVSDSFQASEMFWSEYLNKVSPMHLPFDGMAPAGPTYKGARVSMRVEPELVIPLKERGMAWNATLFQTMLAVYARQMQIFCKQDTVTMGISVSGRPASLSEHLVGYCAHFIPLCLAEGENLTWKTQVQKTKTALIEVFKHQNVPLARILNQRPQWQRQNLVQVTFNLDIDMALPELTGLQTRIIPQPVTSARYAIGLNVLPEGDRLHLDLDYNADIFQAETMKGFLADFMELLASLI
ncbi:MAG: aminotransferase class III-fold pyridoxal phosphate-dependent enzyme [Hormoscilla sp.]